MQQTGNKELIEIQISFFLCQIFSCYSININQRPSFLPPSRIRTPCSWRYSKSRLIVLVVTPVFCDISLVVTKVSSFISCRIILCLSDSCLATSLVTSLVTSPPAFVIRINFVRSIVTCTPPQKFSTLGMGIPAFSNPSRIFLKPRPHVSMKPALNIVPAMFLFRGLEECLPYSTVSSYPPGSSPSFQTSMWSLYTCI